MNTTLLYPERAGSGQPAQSAPGSTSISPPSLIQRATGAPLVGRSNLPSSGTAARPERSSAARRFLFRGVRVLLTIAVLIGAGSYVRYVVSSATSDQAYINAEMTVLRAPIPGLLRLESLQPGAILSRGSKVFTVENPRFGNQEVNGQLNWVRELTERLRAEVDEAAVRCRQQEQVYRLHEKLHGEKLISDLEFIDEETKLALARSVLTNKQVQARQAEARARDLEAQVEMQKEASICMPFEAMVWAMPAKPGAQMAAHEPVLQILDPRRIWVEAFFQEKHARKLHPGVAVTIRAIDGNETWRGRIELIRAGVGRFASDDLPAGLSLECGTRRVAVKVAMESRNPFDASQFFGVGRSVAVSIIDNE